MGTDVQIVDEVPDGTAFVVRLSSSWLTAQYGAPVALFALLGTVTLFGGLGLLGYSRPVGILVSLLGVVLLGVALLAIRSWRATQGTVALAADVGGVWLTLVPGRRPRIVRLLWSEIDRVRLASWAALKGSQVMFICFDAPAAVRGIVADHALAAATVRARTSLGTPFILSGRGKDTELFTMLRELTPLARSAGVEVESPVST